MITLAIDDFQNIALQTKNLMTEIDPQGSHYDVCDAEEALKCAEEIKPDIVWLDVEMPEANGLDMAVEIKKVSPDSNIVFTTAFSEYAMDAFGLHVSGYLLKPVTTEKLKHEIANLRRPVQIKDEGLLRVQCFGNFEVFRNGTIVKFSRSLGKEALAYLVDRRGAGCTVGEICSVLWEDKQADKSSKSQCRVIMSSLKKDLERIGAGDVLVKNWNVWGIDTNKISCDYYDFLKRDNSAINSFRGEYMAQYSWAEMTVGNLFDITEAGAGS